MGIGKARKHDRVIWQANNIGAGRCRGDRAVHRAGVNDQAIAYRDRLHRLASFYAGIDGAAGIDHVSADRHFAITGSQKDQAGRQKDGAAHIRPLLLMLRDRIAHKKSAPQGALSKLTGQRPVMQQLQPAFFRYQTEFSELVRSALIFLSSAGSRQGRRAYRLYAA